MFFTINIIHYHCRGRFHLRANSMLHSWYKPLCLSITTIRYSKWYSVLQIPEWTYILVYLAFPQTQKIKNECKNGYLAFIFISIITLPFNTFEQALKLSIIIFQLFYQQISYYTSVVYEACNRYQRYICAVESI